MLKIAPETMAALTADATDRFVERVVGFLHGQSLAREQPPEQLGQWVRARQAPYATAGIVSEQGLVLVLAIEAGQHCDLLTDGRTAALLAGGGSEEPRLDRLRQIVDTQFPPPPGGAA